MSLSVLSAVANHELASSRLRAICVFCAMSPRVRNDVTMPTGSSDGFEIRLPVEISAWIWPRRASICCMFAVAASPSIVWVTRVGGMIVMVCCSHTHHTRAVHECVEHLVDGGQEAC